MNNLTPQQIAAIQAMQAQRGGPPGGPLGGAPGGQMPPMGPPGGQMPPPVGPGTGMGVGVGAGMGAGAPLQTPGSGGAYRGPGPGSEFGNVPNLPPGSTQEGPPEQDGSREKLVSAIMEAAKRLNTTGR